MNVNEYTSPALISRQKQISKEIRDAQYYKNRSNKINTLSKLKGKNHL